MRHIQRLALMALFAIGLAASASAASYRGRPVDGHTYGGRIQHPDYGSYEVKAEFHDDRVNLTFMMGGRMVAHLEDTEILDPEDIPIMDHRRGITWSLRIEGLDR